MTATASQALEEWVLFSWQMCTDVCSMRWTGDRSILEDLKRSKFKYFFAIPLGLPLLIESDLLIKMTPPHTRNARSKMTFVC